MMQFASKIWFQLSYITKRIVSSAVFICICCCWSAGGARDPSLITCLCPHVLARTKCTKPVLKTQQHWCCWQRKWHSINWLISPLSQHIRRLDLVLMTDILSQQPRRWPHLMHCVVQSFSFQNYRFPLPVLCVVAYEIRRENCVVEMW